jgi:hypothetical protein
MIKLIRMKSGEDVIGEVSYTNDMLKLEKPAVLMPMQNGRGNSVQMGMVPWQPFSKNTEFSIPNDWIVTVSEPSEDIENGYRKNYGSGIEVPPSQLLVD